MYSILRINKIKNRSQLIQTQNHNLRLKNTPNSSNTPIHVVGANSYKEVISEIEDRFMKNEIKPRINSVIAVEVLLTASPSFFEGLPEEKFKEWVSESYKFAKKEFGENLIQTVLHTDETTPHLHLIFTPITKSKTLSMKELYGGKQKLSQLQTRYSKHMEKFGLKRGIQKSKASHTDIKQYYSLINQFKKLPKSELRKINKILESNSEENRVQVDFEKIIERLASLNTKNLPYTENNKDKRKRGF